MAICHQSRIALGDMGVSNFLSAGLNMRRHDRRFERLSFQRIVSTFAVIHRVHHKNVDGLDRAAPGAVKRTDN
jgi:hypothetical protein